MPQMQIKQDLAAKSPSDLEVSQCFFLVLAKGLACIGEMQVGSPRSYPEFVFERNLKHPIFYKGILLE